MRSVRGWLWVVGVCGCAGGGASDDTDTDATDTDTDVEDVDTDADTDGSVAIPCGEEVCDGAASYCLTDLPGDQPDTDQPAPDTTRCEPLPAPCVGDVTCACLDAQGALEEGAECSGDAESGLSVTLARP